MNTFSQCFCFATHGVAYIWETVHIIRGKLHRYFPYKIISLGFYILVIGSLLLSLNCYIGSLSKPGRRQHAAIITSWSNTFYCLKEATINCLQFLIVEVCLWPPKCFRFAKRIVVSARVPNLLEITNLESVIRRAVEWKFYMKRRQ